MWHPTPSWIFSRYALFIITLCHNFWVIVCGWEIKSGDDRIRIIDRNPKRVWVTRPNFFEDPLYIALTTQEETKKEL